MKYLIFLCLVGAGFTSCKESKPSNFELRKSTVLNLNDAFFQHYIEAQSYLRGFKEVCEGDYYRLKNGRPHIQCRLYSDMMRVHSVFKEYYKLISVCEKELGIKHEYVDYFDEDLVETFPENVFFEKKFNHDQKKLIESTVKFIDPFFDSLTELFIGISPVVNDLELYDLALRHRRRESLEKVKEIYKSYPVYLDDRSVYESCYLLGIIFDFTEGLNHVESNLDYLILLNSLKVELSFLEMSLITHIRSRMGYGGPNSTVFEPEVLVIGPDKVEVNEEFTLIPRHIYKDMWEVYEIEFGGKVRDGKFRITKDTIISGHYKIMKRNGVWMPIPFQKEVYIR